jgi:hypothetical protein
VIQNVTQGLRLRWILQNNTQKYTRSGTWNVRSLYGAGSLKTVARKLAKNKLHLVGVLDVR